MSAIGRTSFFSTGYAALGVGLFLLGWEAIGQYRVFGATWPPFTDVVAHVLDGSRNGLYRRAAAATLTQAGAGYVLGTILGLGTAAIVHSFRVLKPGTDRLSSFLNAIPAIALAPIFLVLVPRDDVGMAIATMNVYFALYVAATSGLDNSRRVHRDIFAVFGANRVRCLLLLDLPSAMPPVVTGLKYAVSAAMIGAIIGEWFGASRGLGVLIVSAMQNYQITLLWGAVLIVSVVSLTLYGLGSLAERFVYRRFQ